MPKRCAPFGRNAFKELTELLTLMRFFPGTTGGKMCFRIRLNARPEGILYRACINPLGSPDCPNAVIASQVSTCPVILIDHQMDRSVRYSRRYGYKPWRRPPFLMRLGDRFRPSRPFGPWFRLPFCLRILGCSDSSTRADHALSRKRLQRLSWRAVSTPRRVEPVTARCILNVRGRTADHSSTFAPAGCTLSRTPIESHRPPLRCSLHRLHRGTRCRSGCH